MKNKNLLSILVFTLACSASQSFASNASQRSGARVTDMNRNTGFAQEIRENNKKEMPEKDNESDDTAKKKKMLPRGDARRAQKYNGAKVRPQK